MLCPVSHAVCNILGLSPNRFGMIPNAMDVLNCLIRRIRTGTEARRLDKDFELLKYLERHGIWDTFVHDVLQQDNFSAVDHHVINHKFAEHFESLDAGEDTTTVVQNMLVPAYMLSSRPELLGSKLKRVRFTQRTPIGRLDMEDMNISSAELYRWANAFDIRML
jgi:hypothetical protein